MPHPGLYFRAPVLLLFLSGFCGILLSGCAAATACHTSDVAQTPQPLLLFQKTPCYGSCPAYDATIYEDGSITYIGYRNAPVEDTLQLCLPKQDLQQLQKAVEALNYTSLQNVYRSQRTDQPSTYLTFYQNSREVKRIRHQEGGPPELLQFQEMVEELVMRLVEEKVAKK
ncbi:hypothetical protein I2I11_13690 [Pontibacter sp. 172403-2]|uniref:DUF6438 domain-containing protein n=1 Tax=Pontibacter rufus TaxID=2791028 RepID=UPI0018AF9B9D|nr:DUF6438 domain-containing protein [Pontibacter sp. 172403-2]MBF9254353.1 hypothetical protein [Pontibacter sp. 172403-2]